MWKRNTPSTHTHYLPSPSMTTSAGSQARGKCLRLSIRVPKHQNMSPSWRQEEAGKALFKSMNRVHGRLERWATHNVAFKNKKNSIGDASAAYRDNDQTTETRLYVLSFHRGTMARPHLPPQGQASCFQPACNSILSCCLTSPQVWELDDHPQTLPTIPREIFPPFYPTLPKTLIKHPLQSLLLI